MEKIAEINGKIKKPWVYGKQTQAIVDENNIDDVERQERSLATKVQHVNTLKDEIVELKFMNNDSEEEITTWCMEMEKHIKNADSCLAALSTKTKQIESNERELEKAEARRE